MMWQILCGNYKNKYYLYHDLSSHFHFVISSYLFSKSIWNSDPFMVQILWLNMSMIICSCWLWIQILEMLSKFLLHIIFNKWTFIYLMSNLMAVCVTRKSRYCNFVYIMNPFTPITWNSFNNASIILIKYGFTIPHFDRHWNNFC